MEKLEKSIKRRYLLFVSSILILSITALVIVQSSITSQILDSNLIKVAGKQHAIGQQIAKLPFNIDFRSTGKTNANNQEVSEKLLKQWDSLQNYQVSVNVKKDNNSIVSDILKNNKSYFYKLVSSTKNILEQGNLNNTESVLIDISEIEKSYNKNIDVLISEYQKEGEQSLKTLKKVIYILTLGTFLLLLGGFLTVIRPAFKRFIDSINQIKSSNEKLAESKLELIKLKTDLEHKDANNKIFIEEAPTALAMLDTNMCYIAASKKWISDYKMENKDIVGQCHYDLFPEIGDDWKANHQKCLNGAIDRCDEAPFVRLDGSIQWIYWDVRPWYISEGVVGGLIMHTGDVTEQKEKEEENERIKKILDRTNEVARIGTWEIDFIKNTIFWSKIVDEIHGVPEGYEPSLEEAINFFKEGASRNAIKEAINDAKKFGTSFDLELELETIKGDTLWTRAIGQAEHMSDKCVRVFGVFQDINKIKLAEMALYKAHTELKAIFNSRALAIVSTDNQGLITHFNRGAEKFLGYSASEMVGKLQPNVFYLEEELVEFRRDMANKYRMEFEDYDSYRDLAKEETFDVREWTFVRKDGSRFPVESTLTTIKDEQGNNIGFLGVSTDISSRKQAENSLIRKNQLLTFAEKITKIGNWQWDVVNKTVELSTGMHDIYEIDDNVFSIGYEEFFSYVHPDDKEKVRFHSRTSIDKKEFKNNFTYRIITTKGTLKIVQVLGEVVTNGLGETVEIIGACQDITAQKLAKNELLRKNHFLSFAEKIAKMGNWQWNVVEDTLDWSDNMHGIYGSDKEATDLNFDTFFSFVHPEDRVLVSKYMEEAYTKKVFPNSFIHRIITVSGELKTVHSLGKIILDDEGDILEMIGTTQDITEYKTVEEELLRKNSFLSFAERIAKMGNYQWNVVVDTLEWSDNMYDIFGHNIEDGNLNYDTFFSYVHPEDKDHVTMCIERAFSEKKFPDNFTHRIITGKEEIKTIHFLGEVILNGEGEVLEMLGTCQDVTRQKMEENKFRGLLESAPDAMVITNEDSKIQIINKQAELLFGYKLEEIYNKPINLLLPMRSLPDHELERKTFLNKLKTTKLSQGRDLFGVTKDEREFPIQMSLSPLKTEEGMLISAAIRDITEQKSAQNKIIAAKNDLEVLAQKLMKNNDQLADFAHITSHNLRAPVSNLNSLLGLYNVADSEEDRVFLFKKFEKVINHLTDTLNNLVDAIKIKNTKIKSMEEVSFINVLNKTKEILTGQIINNGVVITSDFSNVSKIKYDRIYLESIFLNLVGNSIKYKSNKRLPEIFIKSEIVEGKVVLEFRDNGLGIDLEKHGDKLFGFNKVFHRHPEAKGVGLFMVKTQIEALNGTINAISEVDKGTTFIIKF